ncbi:MAG: choice-of-anchor D domain-containing protein [Janthinobacterium lividum]
MRRLLLLLLLAFGTPLFTAGQACTGLCLQQVACAAGSTTSVSGIVYAPNGTDPLPNVLVFIPNAALTPMTPGVSCPTPGGVPDGSPLVGTSTAADGTFHIENVPVGTNIPLVIQSGRWRRLVSIATTTACTDTAFSTRMPKNQSEGDIPQFAVATGQADQVECVLRKVGIDDAEFTNPMSTGRIHLYGDVAGRGGAIIDSSTPARSTLTTNLSALSKYDVLMLPCEGAVANIASNELSNLVQYANVGGRVYASHFSYGWMYRNPPFDSVVNWDVNQSTLADGLGTINPGFYGASTLTTWLQTVGASTTPGQILLTTNKHDLDGVVAPTQSWITLNDPVHNNPVMQFTFNTPVGSSNQCGRVLFNEYHVENRLTGAPSSSGRAFPVECSNDKITAQEQLLEYSLFDLTNEGGQPTLTPTSADFGTAYVGFASAPQTFTWKNNSIFTAVVAPPTTTGDFFVQSNTCSNVVSGASCTIQVSFKPTAVGAATGTLVVTSNGSKLTSTLTGNGSSSLILSTGSLVFGNTDVGFPSAKQVLTLQNAAAGSIPLSSIVQAPDFLVVTTCGTSLAAGASCSATVTFAPTATGTRTGQLSFNGQPVVLTGNGVDFSLNFTPASGGVIAGLPATAPFTALPLAGFSAGVQLSCSTNAPGSTCTVSKATVVPSSTADASIQITTTAKYAVIGYGGFGNWKLALGAFLGSLLLVQQRRRVPSRSSVLCLMLLLLGVSGTLLTGCGSKLPAMNNVFTGPGNYAYTVTATDGQLVHSATYTLTVTAK